MKQYKLGFTSRVVLTSHMPNIHICACHPKLLYPIGAPLSCNSSDLF